MTHAPTAHCITGISGPATLAALHRAVVATQRSALPAGMHRVAAWVDGAARFDLAAATRAGVDTARLLVSQPATWTQAMEIAQVLVRSGAVDTLVLDGLLELAQPATVREVQDGLSRLQTALLRSPTRVLCTTEASPLGRWLRCRMALVLEATDEGFEVVKAASGRKPVAGHRMPPEWLTAQ